MGFEKGNILEPAMGVGNFFGMLPEAMQDSKLYGVELDDLTGRIAKQLYPQADVRISGYEKTDFQNDFFDVAVGNVPFGNYKVSDKPYDKLNFQIHDYFFAKTLDKVRPGGIVAFVTSKGTMDKQSPQVRKYLAQRAELLGAVRLPNTAFKENAGTEVTSDILFFQKRDRLMDIEPDWVHLGMDENGIAMNQYFADHPEMIVGKMEMVSGPFGMESTCVPDESRPFEEQLREAISNIHADYEAVELAPDELGKSDLEVIPADPNVKNYSFCMVDDHVYYRENSIMKPADVSDTMEDRIKGMIGIRDCTQELIQMQMEDYPDAAITAKQAELNELYDKFSDKYGLISSQTNKRAFNQDSSYCLLCSLEKLDDEGKFLGKADMFTKRTIKHAEVVTSVDTASEALAVSLAEKAKVDLDYMAELTGKSKDEITEELAGVIFQNPLTDQWETADEYLSGNVREKLSIARNYAENHPEYQVNVAHLEQVMPKDLEASDIEVRLGATWIDPKYIEDFMRETFQTAGYLFDRNVMGVQYSDVTGLWNVKGKNADWQTIQEDMGLSRNTIFKLLDELDAEEGMGLIERIKMGKGRQSRIYVMRIVEAENNVTMDECEFQDLDYMQNTKTRYSYTNASDLESQNLDENPNFEEGIPDFGSCNDQNLGRINKNINKNSYNKNLIRIYPSNTMATKMYVMRSEEDEATTRAYVKEDIGTDVLCERFPEDAGIIRGIEDLLVDVLTSSRPKIWIGSEERDINSVKGRFMKLDNMLIEDVVASWKSLTEVPKNPRAYMLTMLYNVSTTHVAQIAAEVNHGMRYGFGVTENDNQELMEG